MHEQCVNSISETDEHHIAAHTTLLPKFLRVYSASMLVCGASPSSFRSRKEPTGNCAISSCSRLFARTTHELSSLRCCHWTLQPLTTTLCCGKRTTLYGLRCSVHFSAHFGRSHWCQLLHSDGDRTLWYCSYWMKKSNVHWLIEQLRKPTMPSFIYVCGACDLYMQRKASGESGNYLMAKNLH